MEAWFSHWTSAAVHKIWGKIYMGDYPRINVFAWGKEAASENPNAGASHGGGSGGWIGGDSQAKGARGGGGPSGVYGVVPAGEDSAVGNRNCDVFQEKGEGMEVDGSQGNDIVQNDRDNAHENDEGVYNGSTVGGYQVAAEELEAKDIQEDVNVQNNNVNGSVEPNGEIVSKNCDGSNHGNVNVDDVENLSGSKGGDRDQNIGDNVCGLDDHKEEDPSAGVEGDDREAEKPYAAAPD